MITQPIEQQTFSVLNEGLIEGEGRLNFKAPRAACESFA
jgi:hypothetical protein